MLHNCYIFVKGKKAIKENVTSLGPKKTKELHLFVGLLISCTKHKSYTRSSIKYG